MVVTAVCQFSRHAWEPYRDTQYHLVAIPAIRYSLDEDQREKAIFKNLLQEILHQDMGQIAAFVIILVISVFIGRKHLRHKMLNRRSRHILVNKHFLRTILRINPGYPNNIVRIIQSVKP